MSPKLQSFTVSSRSVHVIRIKHPHNTAVLELNFFNNTNNNLFKIPFPFDIYSPVFFFLFFISRDIVVELIFIKYDFDENDFFYIKKIY